MGLGPVLWAEEKFEARLFIQPGLSEELATKFEIFLEDYTSTEEFLRLREVFNKEGYESFKSAFRSMNKGSFSPIDGRDIKIVIHAAHSIPTNKGKKIFLFTSNQSGDADTPRIIDWRFPFMFIELDIDHKKIYEQVSIKLNPEGTLGMDSYNSPPLALREVRVVAPHKQDIGSDDTGGLRFTGFSVKLSGGASFFRCRDFEQGSRGGFEARVEDIIDQGFTIQEKRIQPLDSGIEIAADLIYNITPRIGISLGVDIGRAKPESILVFYEDIQFPLSWQTTHKLQTTLIRLGIFYWLSLGRKFSFYVNGGVGLCHAEFNQNLSLIMQSEGDNLGQNAKARGFGIHGGSGFELSMNPKLMFFIEAKGRYAHVTGFKGSESFSTYPVISDYRREGALYYFENEQPPRLAILEDEPAGVRKAVLDLQSLSICAGLRFKF
jgi:hypothetical protein